MKLITNPPQVLFADELTSPPTVYGLDHIKFSSTAPTKHGKRGKTGQNKVMLIRLDCMVYVPFSQLIQDTDGCVNVEIFGIKDLCKTEMDVWLPSQIRFTAYCRDNFNEIWRKRGGV